MADHRIIQGDCLDVLRTLESGSVDCIITDPPYCSGGFSEAGRTRALGQGLRSDTIRDGGWFISDNMTTSGLVWLLRSLGWEALRIIKPSGSLLVFCDWRMLPTLTPAIESAGLRYQGLIVWDKGSAGLGTGFRCQHELIMHFTCGKPAYHDFSVGNVIQTRRVTNNDREHQTQKPTDLLAKLISVTCPSSGTVVDPFCGSGSTGVAAVRLGRNFIGVERSTEYCAIARRRIEAAKNQTALFTSELVESAEQSGLF